MNTKEILNEEKYQQAKKKITRISLIILIVGVLIGIALIVVGVVTQNNVKNENKAKYDAAYKKSEQRVAEANARIAEIKSQMDELNAQYNAKKQECDSLKMGEPDWFAKTNQCQREASDISSKITALEFEQLGLQNDNYKELYTPVSSMKYLIFYYIGGVVIALSCFIALMFYLIAKRREIQAFTIQQTMPLAQEAIGKMAPTIGNAAKDIAKGITSGIEEGKGRKE